jgi:hypothetical protein
MHPKAFACSAVMVRIFSEYRALQSKVPASCPVTDIRIQQMNDWEDIRSPYWEALKVLFYSASSAVLLILS